MDDDGVQHFGSHRYPTKDDFVWDTPDWRAEMEARYAGSEWIDGGFVRGLKGEPQIIGGWTSD